MHDTLANRGRISYEPYTPEQQYKQQQLAQEYLDGKTDDIQFDSLRQVRELFVQFRNIYKAATRDIANNNRPAQERREQEKKNEGAEKKSSAVRVGEQEQSYGFGAGKAVRDAKPTRNISNLVNIPRDEFEEQGEVAVNVKKESRLQKKIVNVDKNEAYQQFKSTGGQELNNAILKNIEELKGKKEDIRVRTQQIQRRKERLQLITTKLHQKEDNKMQEQLAKNIIDEQQFELIKEKKVCKRDYKLQLEKIKLLRNEIIELDRNITVLKTNMIQKFEEWFFRRYGISVADLENPLINQNEQEDEREAREQVQRSEDVDEDAVAYIQAKKKVFQIQRAKRSKI